MTTATCSIPACGAPHYGRGWCVAHYRRWARAGDPGADRPLRARTGDGYQATLRRLRITRGLATTQRCADCDRPAAFWSYIGGDPEERTDPARGIRFSLDPDRYRPRCRSCHRRAAGHGGRSVGVDVDRVVALYGAGASTRGIASHLGTTPAVISRVLCTRDVPMRPAGRPQRNTHRPINSN